MDKLNNLLRQTGDIALRRRARWLVEKLDIKEGDKILDVGCGDGFYLQLLSNLGLKLKIIGIDIDKKALKSATKNIKSKNVTLMEGSSTTLPFDKNTFNGVIISEVLEHLEDDVVSLKEVHRVLKTGGKVVLSVPHANYPFFWDPINWLYERILGNHFRSGFWAGIWNQHLRLYEVQELKLALKKSGYKDIKINKLTHYCLPFNHYIINLGARILAGGGVSKDIRKKFSKFSNNLNQQSNFLYSLFFTIDKLNDNWEGEGSALSLVGEAEK